MVFECVARTHVGCKRRLNEDAVLSRPDAGLWAVADGMGGHAAGEVASSLVVELLETQVGQVALEPRREAAHRAILDANARLLALGAVSPIPRTIGATVVALGADATTFWCLWAGDSRAYQLRGAELRQLSRDHSLVQELVDAGVLAPEDAAAHPNANVVRRAVGATSPLDLDLVRGDVLTGDVFLLASDGLTRLVGDEELALALAGADLVAAADSLVETCLQRGAPDNLSLVAIRALV